jgi:CheY-like chemotaxis protein
MNAPHPQKISLTHWSPAGEESLWELTHSINILSGTKLSDIHPPRAFENTAHKPLEANAEKGDPIGTVSGPVLRILMIEDSDDDCDLICYQLKKCGFTIFVERAFCEETMRAALDRDRWDIVFTDHGLPGFSAFAGMSLLHKMGMQIPVICITGTMDPVVIRQILASGVRSCISKNDLSQLCSAVRRALNIV